MNFEESSCTSKTVFRCSKLHQQKTVRKRENAFHQIKLFLLLAGMLFCKQNGSRSNFDAHTITYPLPFQTLKIKANILLKTIVSHQVEAHHFKSRICFEFK